VVVDCGSYVVLEQWLCGNGTRSVRGIRSVVLC
jgi:hypothetical protein